MNEKRRLEQDQNNDRIGELLTRHVRGRLNDAERAELEGWLAADSRLAELFATLSNGMMLGDALSAFAQADTNRALNQLQARMAQRHHAFGGTTRRLRTWLPYAAAVVVTVVAGVWFFLTETQQSADTEQEATDIEVAAANITPGGNRATLTLVDGRSITLDESQTGIITNGKDVTYNDGTEILEQDTDEGNQKRAYYLLTTPKGGIYSITLPDGSKVWLNAESTLKYPNRFDDSARVVELEGEAYFEVRRQSTNSNVMQPFVVNTSDHSVEVLGTAFNVSAYPDEHNSKTTLVTGTVQIVNRQSKIVNRLAPGDQAVVAGFNTDVSKVATDRFTAWKDGFFYFDRLSTAAAISQLARWYDLDVVYEGRVPEANVYAYIDRKKPLGAVLKALEKSGLKFKVKQSAQRSQLIVLGEQ